MPTSPRLTHRSALSSGPRRSQTKQPDRETARKRTMLKLDFPSCIRANAWLAVNRFAHRPRSAYMATSFQATTWADRCYHGFVSELGSGLLASVSPGEHLLRDDHRPGSKPSVHRQPYAVVEHSPTDRHTNQRQCQRSLVQQWRRGQHHRHDRHRIEPLTSRLQEGQSSSRSQRRHSWRRYAQSGRRR